MTPPEIEIVEPKSQSDWRKWLAENHELKESVWLIFHKKNSPLENLSWSNAVDEALCFGWIDSKKQTIDKNSYRQFFSKRKPNSNWSKVNKAKVEKLMQSKLMTQAGLQTIEIAKQNGSWTILDEVEALVVPKDLALALANYKGANKYFESLSNSAKKILLYWVSSAKKLATREKRILEIAECASNNQKPKQFR